MNPNAMNCYPTIFKAMIRRVQKFHRKLFYRSLSHVATLSQELLLSTSMSEGVGGTNQDELVDSLVRNMIIKQKRVEQAMRKVDRRNFCLETGPEVYENSPKSLGYKATISTPQFHAEVLETLSNTLLPSMKAVDIGCGSGYVTAAMAEMVGDSGHVTGVDISPKLLEYSRSNIERHSADKINSGSITLKLSKGMQFLNNEESFNTIYVGFALPDRCSVEPLIKSLRNGGNLLVPIVEKGQQDLLLISKSDCGKIRESCVMSVYCQHALKDVPDGEFVSRKEREVEIKEKLDKWISEYTESYGYKPSRKDLLANKEAAALFDEFSKLRR